MEELTTTRKGGILIELVTMPSLPSLPDIVRSIATKERPTKDRWVSGKRDNPLWPPKPMDRDAVPRPPLESPNSNAHVEKNEPWLKLKLALQPPAKLPDQGCHAENEGRRTWCKRC
ncbi:hypothetical protein E2542_SST27358 [Spatholobus suberectus]|nr:hypothetical protein E2542_SST27358 [Spatholobus suberectus]